MDKFDIEKLQKRRSRNKKIVLFSILPVFVLLFIAMISGIVSSEKKQNNEESVIKKTMPIAEVKHSDYASFNYNLPQSNYSYNVRISDIETILVKDAFKTQTDQYSIPEKMDGFMLTITYKITNPYKREMMAPIPNYYFITSDIKNFTSSTTYSRSCSCQIDNGLTITDNKNRELWQISKEKCGYDNYCIPFKAGEEREFKITFTDPIVSSAKTIVFSGFDQKWKSPDYTRERDMGFVIDIEKKKIIGVKKF